MRIDFTRYNVATILPFVYSVVYLFRKMVYKYLFREMGLTIYLVKMVKLFIP